MSQEVVVGLFLFLLLLLSVYWGWRGLQGIQQQHMELRFYTMSFTVHGQTAQICGLIDLIGGLTLFIATVVSVIVGSRALFTVGIVGWFALFVVSLIIGHMREGRSASK